MIYIDQPPIYEVQKGRDMVCLLKKLLYDLKQSPRQWYKRFDTFMLEQGYNMSSYYSCLYFKGNEVLKSIYLLLYVDDMLLISSSTSKISKLKKILSKEYERFK